MNYFKVQLFYRNVNFVASSQSAEYDDGKEGEGADDYRSSADESEDSNASSGALKAATVRVMYDNEGDMMEVSTGLVYDSPLNPGLGAGAGLGYGRSENARMDIDIENTHMPQQEGLSFDAKQHIS